MPPSDRERRKRRTMNGRLGLALHFHCERSRGISNFFARGIAGDVSTVARHDKMGTSTPQEWASRFRCMKLFAQKTRSRAIVLRAAYRRAAVAGRLWEMGGISARGALFTSTPASFSTAFIKAEAFSVPKPMATADSRFFSATRSAGMGDCRLSANFLIRPASLSMRLRAKLVEKSRFKIF